MRKRATVGGQVSLIPKSGISEWKPQRVHSELRVASEESTSGIRTNELSMRGSLVQSLARAGVRWENGRGARSLFSVSLSHYGFESMAPWWLERKGS